MAINYTEILPFSLETMRDKFTMRHSQEKLIDLAQSNLETKNFKDAIFFFKKVQDSLTQPEEKEAITQNIDKILEMMGKETAQQKGKEESKINKASQEQQKTPALQNQEEDENQQQESSQKSPVISSSKEGVNLKIDNISFSGIEVSSGAKVMEVLNKIFNKNFKEGELQSEEMEIPLKSNSVETQNRIIEEQIFQEVVESRKIKPKELASNISKEDEEKAIELYNEKQRELAQKRKNMPPIEESVSQASEEIPLIDPETEKFYRKSTKKKKESDGSYSGAGANADNTSINSSDGKPIAVSETGTGEGIAAGQTLKSSENLSEKEKLIQKIESSINTGQPLQVQNVAPQQKIQKVNQFNLTYNFQNVFYNKFYLRYSSMFNEAARLVREKKLDEAIDYYEVLLQQKLPETMRLMVQQNVADLKNTIVNTFKHADTIVQMDESGKLVRLDDIDTIRVFEEKAKGKNDVFFDET